VEIFVVQQEGNQAYVFTWIKTKISWIFNSLAGYRPMRRYGGRSGCAEGPDLLRLAETWVPLIEEARPS